MRAENRAEQGRPRAIGRTVLAETSAHVLYTASDPRTGRATVIKSARDDREPLARELAALRALAGLGVVELIDADGDPPRALVLARIAGPTLETRIQRRLLSEEELVRLASRLGVVMERIWAAGWVHGDLKPTNVLLPRGDLERAVLVDFETARQIGAPYAERVSTAFTAPERVVGSPAADAAADIFSLGALLHACREGVSPFEGPTRDASLVRVLAHEPPRLEGLDGRLADRISAMLAKDPAARPRVVVAPLALEPAPRAHARAPRRPPRPTRGSARLPRAIERAIRGGASRIVLQGTDSTAALEAVARWADARRRLLIHAAPSEEPYGSLLPGLRDALGLGESPPFRSVLAALVGRGRFRLPRRSALHLAELLGAEPDAASRRVLAPAHADAELLRRVRGGAVIAALRALWTRAPILTVAAGIDGSSRGVLEELLRGAPVEPLHVVVADGALALEGASRLELGSAAPDRFTLAPPEAPDGAADPARVAAAYAAKHPYDLGRVAQLFADAHEPLRAAYYAWRAAERAFEASDLPRARALLFLADDSLAQTRGSIRSLLGGLVEVTRARLGRWAGDLQGAAAATKRALASLPSGSAAFCDALGERATITGKLGDIREVLAVAAALREPPAHDAALAWDRATSRAAVQLFYAGERAAAEALVGLFRARTTLPSGGPDARRRGLSPGALVTASLFSGRLDEHLELLEQAVLAFRAIGDVRSVCLYGSAAGFALCQLGSYARAEQVLRRVLARASRTDIPTLRALAEHNLGEALAHRPGRLAEAIAIEGRAIDALRRERDLRLLAGSLAYRARMHLGRRDLDAAERDAAEAVEAGGTNANLVPLLFGTLAEVELSRSRFAPARQAAERAVGALSSDAPIEAGEALARLALVRVEVADGRRRVGRTIAARAWRGIRARAAGLRPGPLRTSFLERVPEHRALRRLAGGGA